MDSRCTRLARAEDPDIVEQKDETISLCSTMSTYNRHWASRKKFLETWHNGRRAFFSEMCDRMGRRRSSGRGGGISIGKLETRVGLNIVASIN
jgi:hypothetical protein